MIKYCTPLSADKLDELKQIYYRQPKQELAWRKGAEFEPALAVLRDYVSNELGHNYWKCTQGTFFEAFQPYRIHTDTSTEEHNHQTIVFPLDWTYEDDANLNENSLYIFRQRWAFEATNFRYGSKPSTDGPRHNTDTRDYSKVENLEPDNYIDYETAKDCDHLKEKHFTGLSVEAKLQWQPGHPLTFPRTALHCSNNWHRLGIKSKLGLSLFTCI